MKVLLGRRIVLLRGLTSVRVELLLLCRSLIMLLLILSIGLPFEDHFDCGAFGTSINLGTEHHTRQEHSNQVGILGASNSWGRALQTSVELSPYDTAPEEGSKENNVYMHYGHMLRFRRTSIQHIFQGHLIASPNSSSFRPEFTQMSCPRIAKDRHDSLAFA